MLTEILGVVQVLSTFFHLLFKIPARRGLASIQESQI